MPTPAPLPTPYDITPIPFFPMVPGALAWCVVLFIAFVIAALISRIPLSRRGSPSSALATAQKELQALTSGGLEAKALLSGASLTVRRLLASLTAMNLRSATASEIREFASGQPESIQALLTAAAAIEETRFIPSVSREKAELEVETLMKSLRAAREHFSNLGGKK